MCWKNTKEDISYNTTKNYFLDITVEGKTQGYHKDTKN